jgi:hypothetical protein
MQLLCYEPPALLHLTAIVFSLDLRFKLLCNTSSAQHSQTMAVLGHTEIGFASGYCVCSMISARVGLPSQVTVAPLHDCPQSSECGHRSVISVLPS